MTIPTTSLRTVDGTRDLPLLGLGTYPMQGDECARAVVSAIELGYRMFDTAAAYGNEAAVGQGIRDSGIDRDEVIVTSKLRGADHGRATTRAGLESSLERLGMDRVDVYLIHWPNPSQGTYVESFEQMLEAQRDGLIGSVGVSNFIPEQLGALHEATGVWPAINQIQLSPLLARTGLRSFLVQHDIVVQSWGPLGQREGLPDHPVVAEVAAEAGLSIGLALLRWCAQQQIPSIPKSASRERQAENLTVFDVSLTDDQMARLSALDAGEDAAWDSRTHEEY